MASNDTAAANAVLGQVEVGSSDTPEQLRERAAALDAEFAAAVAAPMRLSMESARLRARATAVEKAREAEAPVREAEAAVAAAEERYAATAEPVEHAATRCAQARHLFEQARDGREQALAARAEPAQLIDLDQRATSAANVDIWETEALAEAQAMREGAKRQLDIARAGLAHAREDLEKAQAAIDAPLQAADRPLDERFQSLFFCWPTRVSMRSQPGWEMDATDLALARWLCEMSADDLGVVPARLATQIRAEAAQEATKEIRGLQVSIPGTAVDTTVGALVGAPVTR